MPDRLLHLCFDLGFGLGDTFLLAVGDPCEQLIFIKIESITIFTARD